MFICDFKDYDYNQFVYQDIKQIGIYYISNQVQSSKITVGLPDMSGKCLISKHQNTGPSD